MSGTTQFDQVLYGYRLVQTNVDDTLPRIALRELGDGTAWPVLVAINDLVWPYLTDDPAEAGNGVILAGGTLLVPSSGTPPQQETNANDVYCTDLALPNGLLTAAQGDFATISGPANLVAALDHRLETRPGELVFHSDYGCQDASLIGTENTATTALFGGRYAKTAIEADPRINQVTSATATVTGDELQVVITAETIVGKPITITKAV
jgi:phage baseplate assembly protein W